MNGGSVELATALIYEENLTEWNLKGHTVIFPTLKKAVHVN